MLNYVIRRLILLPITLFAIVLVNFVIVNLAPGEPVTVTEISQEGAAQRKQDKAFAFGSDEQYLQFREHYGLTLPILCNDWPFLSQQYVMRTLDILVKQKPSLQNPNALSVQDYDALRIKFGDQAQFIMPKLLHIILDPSELKDMRILASQFFVRGGTKMAYLGPDLTEYQQQYNRKISKDNTLLESWMLAADSTPEQMAEKGEAMKKWYEENEKFYDFAPSFSRKVWMFFFETRFCRYMGKVLALDFGTLRNDPNKTVISEVTKRFKYSLTLSILPMLITFVLCQLFAFAMALQQNRWPDFTLNVIFLTLYAIPIFVVAPFLIEEAVNKNFLFTNIPIPISGFSSPEAIYGEQTSGERLFDIVRHICLPVIAIMYGGLAAQTRISRTAILEVMRQDYVRTAYAKGVSVPKILFKHIGRNASVTIVTSIAGSLGIILGGTLIVETIFDIHGFGKFFYDAVINRDYNVIMFSALSGAFLALLGYLTADIAYMLLDPRVTLE